VSSSIHPARPGRLGLARYSSEWRLRPYCVRLVVEQSSAGWRRPASKALNELDHRITSYELSHAFATAALGRQPLAERIV
jgi:hypothetical protein